MPRAMTIGQLAKAAGVGVETIRYYQRRGILTTPSRPLGSQRKYPEESLKQLAFIRRAQQLGFTLEEMVVLLRLRSGAPCAEGRAHAQRKLEEIETRVAELNRVRRKLRAIVRECDANKRGTMCPLIRVLEGG
jgi:MerR family transcriptional regulator, mercuric resistance operon regulatory protein